MAAPDSRTQGPTLTFQKDEVDNSLMALDRALAVVELVRHHAEACRYVEATRFLERRAGAEWGINSPGEVNDRAVSVALYQAYDDISGVRSALRAAHHRRFDEFAAKVAQAAEAR